MPGLKLSAPGREWGWAHGLRSAVGLWTQQQQPWQRPPRVPGLVISFTIVFPVHE